MKQGLSKSEIQTSIISPSSSKVNNMNRSSSNITSLGSSKSYISPTMNPLLYQGVQRYEILEDYQEIILQMQDQP